VQKPPQGQAPIDGEGWPAVTPPPDSQRTRLHVVAVVRPEGHLRRAKLSGSITSSNERLEMFHHSASELQCPGRFNSDGFRLSFRNGWMVSVQWPKSGFSEPKAEVAVINPDGDFFRWDEDMKHDDTKMLTSEEVAALIAKVASAVRVGIVSKRWSPLEIDLT